MVCRARPDYNRSAARTNPWQPVAPQPGSNPGATRCRGAPLLPAAPRCAQLRPAAPRCAQLRPAALSCAQLCPAAPRCAQLRAFAAEAAARTRR